MRTISQGDAGSTVELLQLALRRAGLLDEAPDGVFGPRTHAAAVEFQRRSGLEADGIVGPRTWEALCPYMMGLRVVQAKAGETLENIAARWGSDLVLLRASNPGLTPENLRPGVAVKVPLPFRVVPTDVSWSSDLLAMVVDGLCARYPFLRVDTLGLSAMGRPIFQLSIGTGERRVGYNAAHHANEWITTPVLLKFLEQCAEGLVRGGAINGMEYRKLFEAHTLDIVPMVNPDGVGLA